ncbi:MAG: amidase family protein, partial [Hyphomonas sp.]|nr:amidase family protein [Hyphomonas sp.]
MSQLNRRGLLKSGAALAALTPFAACAAGTETEGTSASGVEPTEAATPVDTPPTYTAQSIPDGLAQLAMLRSGETTSLALTEAAIERSQAADMLINAVATETYADALETAQTPPEGAMGGVPTFIKDLLDWKGDPTLYGSRAFQGYVAPADAAFAAAWRKTGVISLGKST